MKPIVQAPAIDGWVACKADMVCSPGRLAETVFPTDTNPLYRGAMFAYLFRRFGYPIYGWDDYKSLVQYYLTTPDDEVVLLVDPNDSVRLSFGYGLAPRLAQAAHDAEIRSRRSFETTPIYQQISGALIAAMRDLQRPVAVRDVLITFLGRPAADDQALAERSPQAGYGVGDFDPAVVYGDDPSPQP